MSVPPEERLAPSRGPGHPAFLITAAEAFPELERLFLGAREEIVMGFRIFDPRTPLYSAEGLEVGEDWFDLVAHTLSRGVNIHLALSDFDPVVGTPTHRLTWRSIRILLAAEEVARAAGATGRLRVIAAMHPARVAPAARAAIYTKIRGELAERTRELAALAGTALDRALSEMPGLTPWLSRKGDLLSPRSWPIAPLAPVTHHQKLATFDGETLYIGGLDLDERRFDGWDHDQAGPETWHDVQVVTTGPVAADARGHILRFLDECDRRIPVAPAGALLRTLSRRKRFRGVSMSPDPTVSEILDRHLEEIGRAERLIYLESQFFRDRTLARALASAADERPELNCVMILPAAPEDVAFDDRKKPDARLGEHLQARCLRRIQRAFGPRLFVGCPAQRRREESDKRDTVASAPLIYVHAKVSVFDDRAAIVSSANLNGRSMRWDTEAGAAFDDPADVAHLRARCWQHWLGVEQAKAAANGPDGPAVAWARIANANAAEAPERRRGFILPYPVLPGQRFGAALPGVPEEMV
ncbi:MAG: phospholipase D-like domain-containing protein [Hasllibacter sp.]